MNKANIVLIASIFACIMVFSSVTTATYPSETVQTHETYYLQDNISGSLPCGTADIHNLNSQKQLSVVVSLGYSNNSELNTFLNDLQNPKSPVYHNYLSAAQFDRMFSPSYSTYYSLAHYFLVHGFKVKTFSDRVSLVINGKVGTFENVFGTELQQGKYMGREIYAPSGRVHMSTVLASHITDIVGLSNVNEPQIEPFFENSYSSQTLYGADLQNAYQLSELYEKYGYPSGETVATILWAGNDSNGEVAPFVPSDISYYFKHNLPSGEPTTGALKSFVYGYPVGGAKPPGPSAASDSTNAHLESTLDLEMAGSTAPGADLVEVYGPSATLSYLDQAFAAILSPWYNSSVNNALSHVVAISCSWGYVKNYLQDTYNSTWKQYEQEAAARGITVLAASGDDGNNFNNTQASFPSSMAYDSFGTLAVGGSEVTLTGSNSTNGSGTTGISTQRVWYNWPLIGDGSQGGWSPFYKEPSWQNNSADANSVINNPWPTHLRCTPDISAVAANMTIYVSNKQETGYMIVSGTSVSSPLVAGMIATIDNSLQYKVGFVNPLIYRLAQAEKNGSYSGERPFYFISNGSNYRFPARDGYSLSVGWGTINAYNFVTIQPSIVFTENGIPPGTTWSVALGGDQKVSSGSAIRFRNLNEGTYAYTVSKATYSGDTYDPSPSSGSITILPFHLIHIVFNEETNGGGGTQGCVPGSTEVLLANMTYIPAANLTARTWVMTYNITSGLYSPEQIMHVMLSTHSRLYTINSELQTSAYQPILTKHGYVTAQNLTLHDRIFNAITMQYTKVSSITVKQGNYTMYDFMITPNHDYIAFAYIIYDVTRVP